MKLFRKAKALTLAAAAGATTAYLFDPRRGPQRRQHLTSSVQRAINQVSTATAQVADIRETVGAAVSGSSGDGAA